MVGAALPAEWPETLKKRWEVPAGTGHASPVVYSDRVVVIAREGEQEIVRAGIVARANPRTCEEVRRRQSR